MKRLVVKFLEDRYTWNAKTGKSPERDQVKLNLEALRQQLAKVSSEIATLTKQIESMILMG